MSVPDFFSFFASPPTLAKITLLTWNLEMPIKPSRVNFIFSILLAAVVSLSSCQDTACGCDPETLVYSNDFSKLDLANFENGRLFVFQRDTLLGNYHNEEVSVTVPNLPSHNIVKVTVELWTHDSWDGNPDEGISGPDYWYMVLDGQEIFRTTFSNSPCVSTFCLRQSYPATFFRQNDPKTGAIRTNLPGLCLFSATPNYTTVYSFSKLIEHDTDSIKITLGDELRQTNSPNPKCDESWSVGKITVHTLTVL
jgi:hypothetical protein